MIRPTSAGGATSRVKAGTHARAKSTAVPSTSRPPSRDQNTSRTVRPPSRDQNTLKTVRPPSRDQANRTSRPPSREAATVGTRTGHGRAVSTEKTGTQTPRARAGFSTLQQHYSPVKTPGAKPATSLYTGPPSPSKLPANVAASAETSRLQTELLQLHIMYRDAAEVEAQWHASAKEKLGAKFEKLSVSSREVSGLENAGVEAENAKALRNWASGDQLESNIQALDTVMNGVWMLSEPGGKYAKLVRRFERWMERVWDIEEARNTKDGGQALLARGQDSLFIEELGQLWRDECAAVTRKLEGWRKQLEEVGEYPADGNGKSSLERMLEGSRALVFDMLVELEAMEDIETAAVAREEAWIDEMNRDGDNDEGQRAGAIWRAV